MKEKHFRRPIKNHLKNAEKSQEKRSQTVQTLLRCITDPAVQKGGRKSNCFSCLHAELLFEGEGWQNSHH